MYEKDYDKIGKKGKIQMSLIRCPECNREMSDTVKTCPHCGYKLPKVKKERTPMDKKTQKGIIFGAISFIVICGVIGVFYAVFGLSDFEKAQVVSLNNFITEQMQVSIEDKSEEQLSEYKEECQKITEEYSKLKWKQKRKIDEYDAVEERLSEIDNKIADIKDNEVQNVINLINAVGNVTLESKAAIDNARKAYGELDDEQRKKVTNYNQVSVYEKELNELCLNDTIRQIKAIGKVTLEGDSKRKIENAEKSYESLSSDLKAKVTNYKTLQNKREKYDKLEKYKGILLRAKSDIKDGLLNTAKSLLKDVPSKFQYKGTKASALKKQLSSKSAWVNLCGIWKTTGGEMRVTQIWDYDGRSQWWYRKFSKGEEEISVKCQLLSNGKVKVKLNGEIPIYTSYSSIQAGLETSIVAINKTKTMSGMGTIRINSHTTVSLSSSGLTVNYYKVNPNEDQYFTYKYKSTMSLKKRTKKY